MDIKIVKRTVWALWIAFIVSFLLFMLMVIGIQLNFLGLFGAIPDTDDLENPRTDLPVEIYAEDGVLLGRYFREKRLPVSYEKISPHVIHALISTEDTRFYHHSGIDAQSIAAIFWYVLKGDNRGGSTISQQLAKNMYKTRTEKSDGVLARVPFVRLLIYKVKEWITAIRLEGNYTKKEILTMYLNTVDFGSNAFGINVAARRYFNVAPDSLSIPQAATLVGLLKATTTYSPVLNPKNCLERRNLVVSLMGEQGYIREDQMKKLQACPLEIDLQKDVLEEGGKAPYLQAEVFKFLQEWCKNNGIDMYSEGLKVYTTINSSIQHYAEEAVQRHMAGLYRRFLSHWQGRNPWVYENKKEIPGFIEDAVQKTGYYAFLKEKYDGQKDSIDFYLNLPKKMSVFSWKEGNKDTTFSILDSLRYYKHFLHTGFMAVNPHTGEIQAWIGGINFRYFQYDHVKQAKRQPGSAFKPIVYTAAMERGLTPCDSMVDKALIIQYEEKGKRKTWAPKNADWVFTNEKMTLRKAMARSVNSIAAGLMQQIGYNSVITTARKLGIRSDLKAVPSLALGASDVSVYELTGAYATFVNEGTYLEPYFINRLEDNRGNVVYESQPEKKEALSKDVAYTMLHMLAGGTEIRGGTSQALFAYDIFRGNQIGGKTGTTSNYSDGWFVGVTKDLVAGMWVGGEDRCIHFTSSATGEGSKTALPIFGIFMEKVYADTSLGITHGYFRKPKGFSVNIDCPEIYPPEDTTETEMSEGGRELLDSLLTDF